MYISAACVGWLLSPASLVLGVYSGPSWEEGYSGSGEDADMRASTRSSGSFKLRTPHFSLNARPWFDVEKEQNHWREVNARLKVLMNSKIEADVDHSTNYDTILRKDVAVANELDKQVQRINAMMQSEPLIRKSASRFSSDDDSGFSLLQVGTAEELVNDWSFCSCESGANGTLVDADRVLPAIVVPDIPSMLSPASSMLQVQVRGRRVALERADECNCVNPWESYFDPSGSSLCSGNDQVTVCLIRRNLAYGRKTPEQLRAEAAELMQAIDDAFDITTYVPSAKVNATLDDVVKGAGNITKDIGNWTIENYLNTTTSGGGSGNGTNNDLLTTLSNVTNSTETMEDKFAKIRWEAISGEPVEETVKTGVTVSTALMQKGNSFAELWRPFRFQL